MYAIGTTYIHNILCICIMCSWVKNDIFTRTGKVVHILFVIVVQ